MSSDVCVWVRFGDCAMCTQAKEICRSVQRECQECQCNSNSCLPPEASATWKYFLHQKWANMGVCVWLYIRAWSCIRSLIHGCDSPLASPASNRRHLGTCAKVPQCFPNTCTEKQDFPDFPAVLTWPTPPESSSQAFSKPFIWYHNISANPSLPPFFPSLSVWLFHGSLFSLSGFDKDWRNNYSWA